MSFVRKILNIGIVIITGLGLTGYQPVPTDKQKLVQLSTQNNGKLKPLTIHTEQFPLQSFLRLTDHQAPLKVYLENNWEETETNLYTMSLHSNR